MALKTIQRWAAERAHLYGIAAFSSAIFLSLAMLMPNRLARTSWFQESGDTFSRIVDSPASYVGLVSLCGLVALVTLSIGMWRRSTIAAALAAAAFGYAALVAGNSWLGLLRGVILLDGKPTTMSPPEWEVNVPFMLPLFLLAAIVGAIGAGALAIGLAQPSRLLKASASRLRIINRVSIFAHSRALVRVASRSPQPYPRPV